jgi:hypothetical protein
MYSTPSGNKRDGLSASFDRTATVHNASLCRHERHGCTDSTMQNYDPLATVSAQCYPRLEGCLNSLARNFRCPVQQYTPCTGTDVQLHSRAVCVWEDAPPMPPSAPPPPFPPGQTGIRQHVISIVIIAAGDVSDYDDVARASLASILAAMAGVDVQLVRIIITSASVHIEAQVIYERLEDATAALSAISSAIGSTAAEAAMVLGIPVQSVPQVEAKTVMVETTLTQPAVPTGLILGPAGGGIALLLMITIAVMFQRRKRAATVAVDPGLTTQTPKESKPSKRAWIFTDYDDDDI